MRLEAYALQKKKVRIWGDYEKIKSQKWLKEAVVEALECEPIELELDVLFSAQRSRISAAAKMSCSYQTRCARCGSDLIHSLSSDVVLEYLPDEQTGHIKTVKELERITQEVEIDADELNIGWYASNGLEVRSVITELIALEKNYQIHLYPKIQQKLCLYGNHG